MRFRKRYVAKILAAISVVFFIGILMMRTEVRTTGGDGGEIGAKPAGRVDNGKLVFDRRSDDQQKQESVQQNPPADNEVQHNAFHLGEIDESKLTRIDWTDWEKINQMKLREASYEPNVCSITKGYPAMDWCPILGEYHALIRFTPKKPGPGEQGRKVVLDEALKKTEKEDTQANGFNERISDMVSLDRAVKDIRHPGCKDIKYLDNLPTTSVVIPFHNEALSALKRTVHSVFNMSPPKLIQEIILVDDYSNREYLKKELDDYMQRFSKVRILRNAKREGLIRTRLYGAGAAVGDVVLFLDSHCEANVNWLPPLLERIALNRRCIACPMIDVISNEDFHYETQAGDVMRGAFDWELYYKRIPINEAEMHRRKADTDPVRSPIMAGGLFAIDRKYFMEELGGYDDGLEIWGGEQYDLSFKVWMCGGIMEEVPCSRVGHIYRKFMSYSVPGGGNVIGKNLQRVVEVWMDEWKEHFYKRKSHLRGNDFGDISKQLALRERLKCKNFTWFMTEVAPDVLQYYPAVEPDPRTKGLIRSSSSGDCLSFDNKFTLQQCTQGIRLQEFTITWHDDMRHKLAEKQCIDFNNYQIGKQPGTFPCHNGGGNQLWIYNPESLQIYHPSSGMCLDIISSVVGMNNCDMDSKTQRWDWPVVDAKKVSELAAKHPVKYLR